MKIHYSLDNLAIANPVVTVGTMDGVHLGHRLILRRLHEYAMQIKGESVLITFWPHPRRVVHGEEVQLLNTLDEKIQILSQTTSLQHLIVLEFTEQLSQYAPQDFITNLLYPALHFKGFLVGYDHHFGRNRAGDFELVKHLGHRLHFEAFRIEALSVDGDNVSSTKIRKALFNGQVEKANRYLGYAYPLSGAVVQGDALGRRLGFPTANVSVESCKLLPLNGVYAAKVFLENKIFKAVVNIGVRPTVAQQASKRVVEVHLFDFDGDIYGKPLRVELIKFIRAEQKFLSLQDLKRQIENDKITVQNLLL